MIGYSMLLAVAVAGLSAEPQLPADRQVPVERCAFSAMGRSLADASQWRDLTAAAAADAGLAAEFADMMPDYRLAFVHDQSLGLLLVGGDRVPEMPRQGAEYWDDMAAATRRACDSSGVACEVDSLSGAVPGMAATTHLGSGDDLYRRETVAFIGGDRCRYSVQFVSPEAALSEGGWRDIRQALLGLREIVPAK